jgi:hypothetical protein
MGFVGLKTLKDVLNSRSLSRWAARAGSGDSHGRDLNLTLGTKFDVIPARGNVRLRIALQVREVDGACFGWEAMRVIARTMLEAKGDDKLIPFVTHGDFAEPRVKDLPRLTEVIKGTENQAILNAYLLSYNFERPFMLPPGTPKEQLSILRKAFKATLEDPEFLAEAKRSELVINYVSGEEIEKFVAQILGIAPKTREKLQFLVK